MPQPQGSVARSSDAQPLARLAEIAERLSEASIEADIQQLVARIDEGRFFVASSSEASRPFSTLS